MSMSPPGRRLLTLMAITVLCLAVASPATALPGRPWPSAGEVLAPVDPQNWENPDAMTWSDLRKVPDIDWSDPARKGSVRTIKAALVLGDYPNEQFAITRARNSDIYGNPR